MTLFKCILALDGSVLIGLALGEPIFRELKDAIKEGICIPFTHDIAILEMLYIICRKAGMQVAKHKLILLQGSRMIEVIPCKELLEFAFEIKCTRKISLADALTIALAKKLDAPAVFAKMEKELKAEITREPFDVDIIFVKERIKIKRKQSTNKF